MKKRAVLLLGLLLISLVLSRPVFCQIPLDTAGDLHAICYGKQRTWIQHGTDIDRKAESVNTLLRIWSELNQEQKSPSLNDASSKRLPETIGNFFADQKYDCIVAFPASFSYQRRLQAASAFGANVGTTRISTASEIAALGYNHFHLPLDKTKEQYSTKLFVVIDNQYISATLAELGYLGVVEVHGSVGAPIATEAIKIRGYGQIINQVVGMISRLPQASKHRYDEIVISGTDKLDAIAAGMKANLKNRVPVSGYEQLVTKGLLTQSAMLSGSPEAKDDLLLVATPNSSLGVVLPVAARMRTVTRVSRNAIDLLRGAKESELPGGILGGDVIELKPALSSVQEGSFFEVVSPFTTIPTRKVVEVDLSSNPAYLIIAEHTGDSVLAIQKVPWEQGTRATKDGNRFEISFDIDANMMMEVSLKNLVSGSVRKYRIALGGDRGAPANTNKMRR